MKKTIYIFGLVILVSCGFIERMKLKRHDEQRIEGVFVSLLDDYLFKDVENQLYFENNKVIISNEIHNKYYFYYILWKDGRCFFSTAREKNQISVQNILYNKEGSAGYYKINNDTLWTEFYSDRTFIYHHFKIKDDGFYEIGQKVRKPFKKKMRDYNIFYYNKYVEKYTQSGSDSVYFNQDSVALWKPFW